MFRTAGLMSAWMALALAICFASAQEPAAERTTPRIRLPQTLNQGGQNSRVAAPRRYGAETDTADTQQREVDRVREFTRTKIKVAPRTSADALAGLGASAPFAYSAGGSHLVAAVRDGAGLAIWETANRRQLHRLENSDRRYSLVAISEEPRWIAAVRHDNNEQIDLWRVDNGQHVRVILAVGGRKSKLEFSADNELRVFAVNGDGLVFRVPAGVAIGGFGSRDGGSAVKRRTERINSPKSAMPTAPSTTRAVPPFIPPVPMDREAPSLAEPVPQNAPPIEPRIPSLATPRSRAPRAAIREPREEESPRIAAEGPALPPAASVFEPAAPAASEPASAAPSEGPPAASYEPSGGAAPEASAEAPMEFDAAAPAAPRTEFHFEMGEESPSATEPPTAAQPSASAVVQPPAEAAPPATVNIHFATNRNRLAPKDREWLTYFLGFFASLPAFVVYGLVIVALLIFPWFGKRSWAAWAALAGSIALCAMGSLEAYVRSQLRDEMTGELYGCRPTDLSYGTCEISVPPPANRRTGDVSRPVSVWIFEAPENPDKHFTLRHVEEHDDKDAFYRSLSARLANSDSRAAMLFIHGYNVSFEDAIFRTAQLAVDLKFPGAPIAFCWPSYADPIKYTFDEQNAEVSIPALREVLDDLAARSGAKRIHIIAHSMGNRVLAGALRNMDSTAQARNKQVFRELILAAPDIDRRVFQSQVLPHIALNTQHCTLYASSRDRALLASRCFHNYQRLGESQPELVVANGLDTIDASLVDTSLLGHSYIGDVQSIVSDLHDLLVDGKRAAERLGLESFERNALKYWSIKPQLETAIDPSLRR